MLLGQAMPGAVELAGFLGAAFFCVGLVNAVMRLVDRLRDKPPAGEVRAEAAEKYALKSELRELATRNEKEHDNFFGKIGGVERGLTREIQEMERRLNKADEERTLALHERMNDLLREVGRLSGLARER